MAPCHQSYVHLTFLASSSFVVEHRAHWTDAAVENDQVDSGGTSTKQYPGVDWSGLGELRSMEGAVLKWVAGLLPVTSPCTGDGSPLPSLPALPTCINIQVHRFTAGPL